MTILKIMIFGKKVIGCLGFRTKNDRLEYLITYRSYRLLKEPTILLLLVFKVIF